jgi:hypothetical protein
MRFARSKTWKAKPQLCSLARTTRPISAVVVSVIARYGPSAPQLALPRAAMLRQIRSRRPG